MSGIVFNAAISEGQLWRIVSSILENRDASHWADEVTLPAEYNSLHAFYDGFRNAGKGLVVRSGGEDFILTEGRLRKGFARLFEKAPDLVVGILNGQTWGYDDLVQYSLFGKIVYEL